jgi:uncharacterized protein YkwD
VTRLASLLTIAAVLAAAGAAAGAPVSGDRVATFQRPSSVPRLTRLAKLEQDVIKAINGLRRKHKLAPVRLHVAFSAEARAQSLLMAKKGFFAHSTSLRWHRLEAHWSLGQSLAWRSPDMTAQWVVQYWLKDPQHRKILLGPSWTVIGVGAVHADPAPGVYGGAPATIITADLGASA